VVGGVRLARDKRLPEVALADHSVRALAGPSEYGEEDADEYRDHRDDDQQLDERES